ncbi:LytR/AlgR family response regulator transcription factor [Flavobacterium muglaense]|uniref:Response regulator transcription factor n=1 Tax=Flavobacterium muglaense TaxID=2764716 RepID=A0A923N0G5_9FLAO|nr:LytTR family DNA-binding domain-containing protein [Flavobacterium muglaense]MBC5838515.1 response regulator transcription factor [Flavobacterium muglaense]MBC5845049.1 response regulator transcription factor [Flavobacterium muglaense]
MIKCIVIDDEQPAIDIMKHYISKIPELDLIGTYNNPLIGMQEIKKKNVVLVFLDIQMEEMTGLEVMNIISENVKVILCTAYPQFALNGYDLDAIDYLLKPISFDRFSKAVKKALSTIPVNSSVNNLVTLDENHIFIKTEQKGKLIKIYFKDVYYIEAMGNYIAFHQSKNKIMAYSTLKDLVDILPTHTFMRVHKSYIVALPKITMIENGFVALSNGHRISIGANYKEVFMAKLKFKML